MYHQKMLQRRAKVITEAVKYFTFNYGLKMSFSMGLEKEFNYAVHTV